MKSESLRLYRSNPPSMRWLAVALTVMMVLVQLPVAMDWWWPGVGHVAWALSVVYLCLPVLAGSRRVAITADAQGCTEWIWPWRRRWIRWAEVTGIEVSDESARIVSVRGTLELDPRVGNWLELAERARVAAGLSVETEAADAAWCVPREEVAAWLGIEVDEALDCRSDHLRRQRRLARWLMVGNASLLASMGLYAMSLVKEFKPLLLLPSLVMLALVWLIPLLRHLGASDQRIEAVRATADALEVQDARGGWRRFAWGSLRRLTPFGRHQVVSTPEGDIMLPPRLTNADRLLGAIEQAIAARRRGLSLPRMTGEGVPEGAISRASEVEVAVERGLSRSEGGAG